jgi:hypothetical protein
MNFWKVFCIQLLCVGSASAEYIDPARQAELNGFTGCATAIKTEMKNFDAAPDARYITHWDTTTVAKSLAFTYVYGKAGDTVQGTIMFWKDGGQCWAHNFTTITFTQTCMQYKEENPAWQYKATLGDYTFTQNKGGVYALLKDFHNGCIVQIQRTGAFPITRN